MTEARCQMGAMLLYRAGVAELLGVGAISELNFNRVITPVLKWGAFVRPVKALRDHDCEVHRDSWPTPSSYVHARPNIPQREYTLRGLCLPPGEQVVARLRPYSTFRSH